MNIDELKFEIWTHYTDPKVPIVTVDKDPQPQSTLNGIMHTGFYLCMLSDADGLDILRDGNRFGTAIHLCQVAPGVYNRYPGVNNFNSHDDACGVAAGSAKTVFLFHEDILKHGINNLFYYNNTPPFRLINGINPLKWNWWAWRLVEAPMHVMWYFRLNNLLAIFDIPLLFKITFDTLFSRVGYGRILNYMMVSAMRKKSKIWDLYYSWFIGQSKLVEATADYFKVSHPLVELAAKVVDKQ